MIVIWTCHQYDSDVNLPIYSSCNMPSQGSSLEVRFTQIGLTEDKAITDEAVLR